MCENWWSFESFKFLSKTMVLRHFHMLHFFFKHWTKHFSCLLELWVTGIRSLPVTTPEPLAAIETYHLRLKSKLFHEQNVIFWPRVDWLIHTLTTEFHSLYWLDQYSMETGYCENLRDDSFSTNAWSQALHIPDVNVMLDEQNLQLAKIISQADRTLAYTIWNPGSEFSLCDCPWSRLGNVCEHVIKLAMVCKSRQVARPLLAAQVYRQALLSLLQNPPDDPLVLEHAIVHATRLQQDIKGLEELSNSGLLQPLPLEVNPHMALNHQLFPRLPWLASEIWMKGFLLEEPKFLRDCEFIWLAWKLNLFCFMHCSSSFCRGWLFAGRPCFSLAVNLRISLLLHT